MTATHLGTRYGHDVLWPMDSRASTGRRKIVRVVWRVPELAEFSAKPVVTEIYDMNDPTHRRMIDQARFRLRYEILSITNYDPAATGGKEEEIDLDDEPLEMSDIEGDDL